MKKYVQLQIFPVQQQMIYFLPKSFSQCSPVLLAQGRPLVKMAQARGCNVPTPTVTRLPIPNPHPLLSCMHSFIHGGLSGRQVSLYVVHGVEQWETETRNQTMGNGQCGMHLINIHKKAQYPLCTRLETTVNNIHEYLSLSLLASCVDLC